MNDEQTPALREAVENMANMREAYDNLSQAAEAYNAGKTELVANITAKGVEASASETLPELAEKVAAIAQESYIIDGGEMYAKQFFGSLETPNYWNLYDILAQLLSDGRLVSYGGILLAEYYRGYDSLALSGAGAGGAYVVSDLDENEQFKMYTEDTTHTWDTAFDGKGNRWVAYCFADEYHDFQITDTNTSPRSIFIGRKVGTITSLVAGRVSQIVVLDGNELRTFYNNGSLAQNFSQEITLKTSGTLNTGTVIYGSGVVEKLYYTADTIGGNALVADNCTNLRCIIMRVNRIAKANYYDTFLYRNANLDFFLLHCPSCVGSSSGSKAKNIHLITEFAHFSIGSGTDYVYIEYITNDKTKSVTLGGYGTNYMPKDIELKDGWCKPLNISIKYAELGVAISEYNIVNHILKRLKQDEPNCGSEVTITLGSTNLAKLTSEESQALLAELRGTYGYTFA